MTKLICLVASVEAADAAVRSGADELLLDASLPAEARADLLASLRPLGVRAILDYSANLPDGETLPRSAKLSRLYAAGLDGVMVSDIGTLRMAALTAPDCGIYWGAPCHMLPDLRFAAAQGCRTAMLSPFLDAGELSYLLRADTIPLMLPVLGELCPGGDRNRCLFRDTMQPHRCRHACRNSYGHGDKAEAPLLSTRDLDLTTHLARYPELSRVLVSPPDTAPECAALYTRLCREALTGKPNAAALRRASRALGRPAPTDAAHTAKESIFVPPEAPVFARDAAFWAEERQRLAAAPPRKSVPVRFFVLVEQGEPVKLAADDGEGHTVCRQGGLPRPFDGGADSVEADCCTVCYQCGSVYECTAAHTRVRGAVSADLAELTRLRDEALEALEQARAALPERKRGHFHPGEVLLPREEEPELTVRLSRLDQLSAELLELRPARLYLPMEDLAAQPDKARSLAKTQAAVVLPRILSESGRMETAELLERLRGYGFSEALVWSPGQMALAARAGFAVRADWNASGSQCLKAAKSMGLLSATLAPWLRFSEIAGISHVVPTELVLYGRLPLLLSRHCLVKPKGGVCACENHNELCDEQGGHMPIIRDGGHGTMVYHAQKLWLLPQKERWRHIGLWAARLEFTTENALETARVTRTYMGLEDYSPHAYTSGYYMEPMHEGKPMYKPLGLSRLLPRRKNTDPGA